MSRSARWYLRSTLLCRSPVANCRVRDGGEDIKIVNRCIMALATLPSACCSIVSTFCLFMSRESLCAALSGPNVWIAWCSLLIARTGGWTNQDGWPAASGIPVVPGTCSNCPAGLNPFFVASPESRHLWGDLSVLAYENTR